MMFAVSRLVWIKKVIRGKVMSQTRFNDTFDDFRQERKVGDRTVIGKLSLSKIALLSRLFENKMDLA